MPVAYSTRELALLELREKAGSAAEFQEMRRMEKVVGDHYNSSSSSSSITCRSQYHGKVRLSLRYTQCSSMDMSLETKEWGSRAERA